jgi:hypothetical protein
MWVMNNMGDLAPNLTRLQTDFQAYLVDSQKAADFKNQMIDDAKVGVEKRLSIYADAYRIRIAEALATAYPKLKMLLGDDFFKKTAYEYIAKHPSTHQNMRWVGGEMASLLVLTLPQHPVAAQLAQFEWALGLTFDAEDAPIASLHDLAKIAPENWPNLRFILHPSVQILPLKWNVVQIWNALDVENTPPNPANIDEPCLVWRQGGDLAGLNTHFRSIDHAECEALNSLLVGANFGDLCANLQSNLSEEEAIMHAAQYLAGWLNDGLITQILA